MATKVPSPVFTCLVSFIGEVNERNTTVGTQPTFLFPPYCRFYECCVNPPLPCISSLPL